MKVKAGTNLHIQFDGENVGFFGHAKKMAENTSIELETGPLGLSTKDGGVVTLMDISQSIENMIVVSMSLKFDPKIFWGEYKKLKK